MAEAAFVAEARDLKDSRPPGPEIAISGRSNVGKSTLLNRLVARKGLARTSKTPGRTRGLVMFHLRFGRGAPLETLSLVDLPGYGYAQGVAVRAQHPGSRSSRATPANRRRWRCSSF